MMELESKPSAPFLGYRGHAPGPSAPAPLQPAGKGDYVVKEGESLDSIAFAHGFFHETLWDHPENAELREARSDRNMLLPGDRVFIPEKEAKSIAVRSGACHRFRRKGVPALLRLRLLVEGEPRRNQEYSLWIDDVVPCHGTTDGEGRIRQWVSPAARTARLVIGPDEASYLFRLGRLRPIEDLTGIQQRLISLDFARPPASGVLDTATIAALREFQKAEGLDPTGAPDEETRKRLQERHDQA